MLLYNVAKQEGIPGLAVTV